MNILVAAEEFHVPTVTELFEFVPLATFQLAGIEFRVTFPMVLMYVLVFLVGGLFVAAFGRARVVPSGFQNFMEGSVDVVREQIVLPTIGAEGERWMPFLCSMFFFVFALNVMGVVPVVNFPITSRMAIPAFLAILSLLIFNIVGVKEHGLSYIKDMMFPSGVPKPIYIILTPVELLSTLIFRPLTLAVRLFANMMAGHTMLAIFFIASAFFLYGTDVPLFLRFMTPFPLVMSIVLIGFEIFISLIQAFIFTILTAVYIAGALHPEH